MTVKAIDVAKWFIKNGFDSPRNTLAGNMKLQKLLFFSQLIHVAKYEKLLFNDEMVAYENGTVVNSVRIPYRDNFSDMINKSNSFQGFKDDLEISNTLELTAKIFGHMTAQELSELNHEMESWELFFDKTKTGIQGFYIPENGIIKTDAEVFKRDVYRVKQMIESIEENKDSLSVEIINGISFYYNPNDLQITDDIVAMLEGSDFDETSYFITYDEEQGLIIS